MSEQTNNQQTLVIGLAVIAVLLAAIVGVLAYQKSIAIPPVDTSTLPATGTTGTGTGATGADTGATGAEAAPVDPNSATKVKKGVEPEAFVKAYYEACDKGDWQAAFDALPTDKKVGNSADALKEQVTGYGIVSWEVTSANVQGDTATIVVDQVTGQWGTFENTWTFTQKDGTWYVSSKAVTGMK